MGYILRSKPSSKKSPCGGGGAASPVSGDSCRRGWRTAERQLETGVSTDVYGCVRICTEWAAGVSSGSFRCCKKNPVYGQATLHSPYPSVHIRTHPYRPVCVQRAVRTCASRQLRKIKKATGFANLPLFSALQLSSYCKCREQEALRNREQLRHSKNGCPTQQRSA